jgi:DNA-binding MarR family transcriptional regulator
MDTERDELGYLIFRICRAQNNLANTIFSEIGLFRGQPPVLFQLGKHKELTQSQLADMLEVTPATLTNILHRMEKTGLINRTRDAGDNRISRVTLTALGEERLMQAFALSQRIEDRTFDSFSEDEKKTIRGFLQQIHANLTDYTHPPA